MFANTNELLDFIRLNGAEGRAHEYKKGMGWKADKPFQHKLIRTILSMSNIEHGGLIIIGVDEINGNYEPVGFDSEEAKTYIAEDVQEAVNTYADPPRVNLKLKIFDLSNYTQSNQNKSIVVIEVSEFDDIPIICKKDFQGLLENGKIYIRTFYKPESTGRFPSSDMRDIIDLAVKKTITKFRKNLSYMDVQIKQNIDEDNNRLYEQESDNF